MLDILLLPVFFLWLFLSIFFFYFFSTSLAEVEHAFIFAIGLPFWISYWSFIAINFAASATIRSFISLIWLDTQAVFKVTFCGNFDNGVLILLKSIFYKYAKIKS